MVRTSSTSGINITPAMKTVYLNAVFIREEANRPETLAGNILNVKLYS